MAAKKIFVERELEWYESELDALRDYIDNIKVSTINDRIVELMGPKGSFEKVVATIEQKVKARNDALKAYGEMLIIVDKLRAADEVTQAAKGDKAVPFRMQKRSNGN